MYKLRIVIELYYIVFSRKAFQVRVTPLLGYLQLIRCSGEFFLGDFTSCILNTCSELIYTIV
jgi:hypothetical protein